MPPVFVIYDFQSYIKVMKKISIANINVKTKILKLKIDGLKLQSNQNALPKTEINCSLIVFLL